MELEEFKSICQSNGLVCIGNDNDEVVTFSYMLDQRISMVYAVWDACDEDDSTNVSVSLSEFHSLFSSFERQDTSCSRATAEWLDNALKEAIAEATKADNAGKQADISLLELRKLLSLFRCSSDNLDKLLSEVRLPISLLSPTSDSQQTVRNLYDKLNKAYCSD